jgi:hypothetical protein
VFFTIQFKSKVICCVDEVVRKLYASHDVLSPIPADSKDWLYLPIISGFPNETNIVLCSISVRPIQWSVVTHKHKRSPSFTLFLSIFLLMMAGFCLALPRVLYGCVRFLPSKV